MNGCPIWHAQESAKEISRAQAPWGFHIGAPTFLSAWHPIYSFLADTNVGAPNACSCRIADFPVGGASEVRERLTASAADFVPTFRRLENRRYVLAARRPGVLIDFVNRPAPRRRFDQIGR